MVRGVAGSQAGFVAVGSTRAVPVTRHVDDVRVVGADVVDVGLQLLAHAGHLVGEEDVGDGGEPVEDVATFVLVEVEREAELAAVGVLEDRRHVAGEDGHAGRRQASGGVAAVLIWSGALTYILLKVIAFLIPLRVSEQHELEGLDLTQHGEALQ